jgi:hypothetical protein
MRAPAACPAYSLTCNTRSTPSLMASFPNDRQMARSSLERFASEHEAQSALGAVHGSSPRARWGSSSAKASSVRTPHRQTAGEQHGVSHHCVETQRVVAVFHGSPPQAWWCPMPRPRRTRRVQRPTTEQPGVCCITARKHIPRSAWFSSARSVGLDLCGHVERRDATFSTESSFGVAPTAAAYTADY